MKKNIYSLLPLLLSILQSHNTLKGMEPYSPYPTKKISFLDELRTNHRFIKAQDMEEIDESALTELGSDEIFELNLSYTQEPTMTHLSTNSENINAEEQKEFNLTISRLISGSIDFENSEDKETISNQPTNKTGFCWTLRFKSLTTRSHADLLLYALESNMFEPNNSDHLALLNQGILECTNSQAHDKLLNIITLAKKKHAEKILLEDKTAEAAYQHLSSTENNYNSIFIENFMQLNTEKQALCKALIEDLQKKYTNTIDETLAIMNSLNSEYEVNKKKFRIHSNENQKNLSALRKLSKNTLIPVPKNISWNEATQNNTHTLKNINLTIKALTNEEIAIQNLSHHLMLDNK